MMIKDYQKYKLLDYLHCFYRIISCCIFDFEKSKACLCF